MREHRRYSAPLAAAEAREFVPFTHELIGAASATIRSYFMSGTAVSTKSDASPVTLADRQAEEQMRALIELRYPGHGVIGEEHGTKAGERYRWVLDPVDGTRAFITNCFLFGTLIALERDDGDGYRPVLGVIAHPVPRLALVGHGAYEAATGSKMPPCSRRPTGAPVSSMGAIISSLSASSVARVCTAPGATASATSHLQRQEPI